MGVNSALLRDIAANLRREKTRLLSVFECMILRVSQDDYDKLAVATDLLEGKQDALRSRDSVIQFVIEAALEKADVVIADRDAKVPR